MGGFRVSESAEADLIAIYDYTEATFGSYQAEAYLSGLERTFELLAEFPLIGLQIDDLAAKHRRFRFQAHHIYYTEDGDGIVIHAVFHSARDIRPDVFG